MPWNYLSDLHGAVTGTERGLAGAREGAAELHVLSEDKSEKLALFLTIFTWKKEREKKARVLFKITRSREAWRSLNDTKEKQELRQIRREREKDERQINRKQRERRCWNQQLKMAVRPAGREVDMCADTSHLPGVFLLAKKPLLNTHMCTELCVCVCTCMCMSHAYRESSRGWSGCLSTIDEKDKEMLGCRKTAVWQMKMKKQRIMYAQSYIHSGLIDRTSKRGRKSTDWKQPNMYSSWL